MGLARWSERLLKRPGEPEWQDRVARTEVLPRENGDECGLTAVESPKTASAGLPVKELQVRDFRVFPRVFQVQSQGFSMLHPSYAHCAFNLLPFQCKKQQKISSTACPFSRESSIGKNPAMDPFIFTLGAGFHLTVCLSSTLAPHHTFHPTSSTVRGPRGWWCSPRPRSQPRKLTLRLDDALCTSTHYIDSSAKNKPTSFNSNLPLVLKKNLMDIRLFTGLSCWNVN